MYTIKKGRNGFWYVVFKDEDELMMFKDKFAGCQICCFDGYCNAFHLTPEVLNGLGYYVLTDRFAN